MAFYSPTTRVQPSTPNQSFSVSQRPTNDLCFNCRTLGHWANVCPFKTPPKNHSQSPNINSPLSPSNSSSSMSEHGSNFPPFPCPNGHGSCLVKTSHTAKNPGRSFYICSFSSSPNSKCGFFKWCDQVKESELQSNSVKRDRNENFPDCGCRAGKCKVVKEKNIEFYVCPITKGHGACSFRKRVNGSDADITTVNSGENDENQESRGSPKRTKFVSPVVEYPDDVSPNPRLQEITIDDEDPDDILDLSAIDELALRERECFVMEKSLQVCSPYDLVHQRQVEFLRQISDSDDQTKNGKDIGQQFITNLISGWLGRLVHTPISESLTIPQPKPFFCCVFPSYNPIYVPKAVSLPQSPGVLSELSSIQSVPGIQRGERDFMNQISKSLVEVGILVQSQLVAILESTDPTHHSSMEEAAEKTFAILSVLSVDHASFSNCVRDFIATARSLFEIENSMNGNQSYEEVAKRYDVERAKFNEISRIQSETENAVTASDTKLRLLEEEATLLKAMLVQVSNRVTECELENADLKARARKTSEELFESEIKLHEAETAKKAQEEREAVRNASKEALESAKVRLQQTVGMI